jgi:hypothetical protein
MAQIPGLGDLQERKRALVAESEVYRQMLRLEVQNIRLYGAGVRRKFAWMRLANPLLLLAGSYVGSRFLSGRPRTGSRGGWSWVGVALMAWRLARSYGPLLQETMGACLHREPERVPTTPAKTSPSKAPGAG